MRFVPAGAVVLVVSLGMASLAPAALVVYDFNNSSSDTVKKVDATSVDPNLTASDFLRVGGGDISPSTDQPFIRSNATDGTDLAGAISSNDYFEFTLTPQSGASVNFTNFTFNYGGTTDASSGLDASFAVLSSLTGFTSDAALGSFTNNIAANQTAFGANDLAADVDLSAGTFQNVTDPVTFRIYVWDQQNANNIINRFDNVIVNGSAAVPEPTAALALLLPAAGCALRRRRTARSPL